MTWSDLDLRGLTRLLAVSEAGSFAQAARDLGLSRQAVHRAIDELERVTGGPLLDRSTRDLRPTPLGRQLLIHAAALRALERSVRTTLEQGRLEPSGSLKITAPPLFMETILAGAVARFMTRWPRVRIQVAVDSGRTNLLREDYDLMIRVGAPPEQHFATRLGAASRMLCATPEHLAAHGWPEDPRELSARAVLDFGRRPTPSWSFIRDTQEQRVHVAPRVTSESPGVVIATCLAGAGILRCPTWAAAPHLASGRLVPVLAEWRIPEAGIWAIYAHRMSEDPTLRMFVDELTVTFDASAGA